MKVCKETKVELKLGKQRYDERKIEEKEPD
jgi:hypothetical protein